MPFLQIKNHQMHYEVVEGVFPRDTILIHGNLGANVWWEPALAEFLRRAAGQDFAGRAILGELRGCGKSSAPEAEADLAPDVMAGDFLALTDALALDRPHLVGHSLGGLIVQRLLCRAGKRFGRAVLLNSVGATGFFTSEKKFALIDRMRADRKYCRDVMATTILNAHQIPAEYLERIAAAAFTTGDLNWRGIPNQIMAFDIRDELRAVENPTLVIHGMRDHVVLPETSREIASLVKNGTFAEEPRGGHSLNVENPRIFADLVWDFLF